MAAVRRLEWTDRRNDALRLMTNLALLWEESEEAALAVTLLGRLLPRPADGDDHDPATNDPATTAQGWALAAMASIWAKGQFERSDELPAALVRAEEIALRSGSTVALLMVLRSRVASSLAVGDSRDAVHGAEEGLAIARARRELWWVNQFLAWSAAAHTMAGERDAAMALAAEGAATWPSVRATLRRSCGRRTS